MWHRILNDKIVESVHELPAYVMAMTPSQRHSVGWRIGFELCNKPYFDTDYQTAVPDPIYDPILGRVFERWAIVDLETPTKAALDRLSAIQYTKLKSLRDMSPNQVEVWIDANIVDLNSAKDALKTLAIAISVLAKRI